MSVGFGTLAAGPLILTIADIEADIVFRRLGPMSRPTYPVQPNQ
jgi:hypothetical protein